MIDTVRRKVMMYERPKWNKTQIKYEFVKMAYGQLIQYNNYTIINK